MTSQTRTVCIVVFDEVEVPEFCVPFEVFLSPAGARVEVCTVAETERQYLSEKKYN